MNDWTFRYKLSVRIRDGEAEDEERAVYAEYEKLSVLDLIKELDKQRKAYIDIPLEDRKEYSRLNHADRLDLYSAEQRLVLDRTRLYTLRHLIAERLELLSDDEAHYLEEQINEIILQPIDDLRSELKELRAILKRHNHKIGGVWTSSAIWSS